jgi:hypothetical protein
VLVDLQELERLEQQVRLQEQLVQQELQVLLEQLVRLVQQERLAQQAELHCLCCLLVAVQLHLVLRLQCHLWMCCYMQQP